MGLEIQLVSRQKKANTLTYDEITQEILQNHQVLINATPLGTYPNIDECIPINFEAINSKHLLFDLVYNPEETLFLQKGKAKGAHTINGMEMLYGQAKAAWNIWNS